MAIIPDSQVPEDISEDTTSEPSVDRAGPRRRRRSAVPHSTLTRAWVVVAAAAVALAIFAFTGRDDPATPGPDRTDAGGADIEPTTPAEYPPNYDPHGYDYGDAQQAEDDSSDDYFVPGTRHMPMR